MQTKRNNFAALYDALPEHEHFANPSAFALARKLGGALHSAKIGVMTRIGSKIVNAVILELEEQGGSAIAFSPAANMDEHLKAFRLPIPNVPLVYTGKGALGADVTALVSSQAMIVIGSYPGKLESILDHTKDAMVPVGVLTDEESSSVHERVRIRHAHMTSALFVSHDPEILVRELSEELRRRELSRKLV